MVTEASGRVRAERERAHEVSSPRRAAGAQRHARMYASKQRHCPPPAPRNTFADADPGKPLLSRLWKARAHAPAPNLEKYPTTLNIHRNPGLHKGPLNIQANNTAQLLELFWARRQRMYLEDRGGLAARGLLRASSPPACGHTTLAVRIHTSRCVYSCAVARTRRSPHRAGDHTPRAGERTGCRRRAAAHLRLLWRCNRQCSLCAQAFAHTPLMRPAVRQSEHERAFEPTATLAPCPLSERARAQYTSACRPHRPSTRETHGYGQSQCQADRKTSSRRSRAPPRRRESVPGISTAARR
jgi:hypothetical protein